MGALVGANSKLENEVEIKKSKQWKNEQRQINQKRLSMCRVSSIYEL